MKPTTLRSIIVLWLVWFTILLVFQNVVSARFRMARPDRVLEWTPADTGRHNPRLEPTLTDPFLNTQVAFDSEFYLSIAIAGYDDPLPGYWEPPDGSPPIPLNYTFFPFYPYAIRALSFTLRPLNLTVVATATLAAVSLSLIGTLAAMIALYDMTRDQMGEQGGLRTAFYLLIFPTGFFLAQVYTEGLFLGLTFGSLALLRRQRLGWAGLLALLALATRGIGLALILPLAWAWVKELRDRSQPLWKRLLPGVGVVLPLVIYALWRYSAWGMAFTAIEEHYFGRQLLDLEASWASLLRAADTVLNGQPQTAVYYGLELAALALALLACLFTWRRYPDLTLFSLFVLLITITTGELQSMQRYVLALPSLFIALGQLGKNELFDRSWTLVSILFLGFLALLYSFDFWTA